MQTYCFRKMNVEDIEAVQEIDGLSFANPWPIHSYEFEILKNENSRSWVFEEKSDSEKRIIAMAVVWHIIDEAHIGTIAVHPNFRKESVGKLFLACILYEAVNENIEKCFLEVRESNLAAQKMYNGFGFIVDGVRKRYYSDNHEDALMMCLEKLDKEQIISTLKSLQNNSNCPREVDFEHHRNFK